MAIHPIQDSNPLRHGATGQWGRGRDAVRFGLSSLLSVSGGMRLTRQSAKSRLVVLSLLVDKRYEIA